MIMDAHKIKSVRLPGKTVWYETHWGHHYQMAGKTPLGPVRKPERTIARQWDDALFAQRTGMRAVSRKRQGHNAVQATAEPSAALNGGKN